MPYESIWIPMKSLLLPSSEYATNRLNIEVML